MKKILTIAGSDSSGGAGIQADIKTIAAHQCYAMSAITALTAQNTRGVIAIQDATPSCVADQLTAIFTDIVPDAVKIGMVSNPEIIRVIAAKLLEYKAQNVVIDPVMVATSGSRLLSSEATDTLIHDLLPLGRVITPNLSEAEVLCAFPVTTQEAMVQAAQTIGARLPDTAVLIKGGHLSADAADLLYEKGEARWFTAERIATKNSHGTGCTLSSAIACRLAQGNTLAESIQKAKAYLTGALKADLDIGHGSGPLNHMWWFE
ncbi:MAG: bifunctional hydroxymethylpyrimidine kinase/phosphomethylpyrimidine kinase [Eubacteriaceae bacterium]|nr:bifunctional hydroxymethylpyrimidine kinase/phosphomethylpyrimidine kinase [Eubacteriaceae bacterium]MDD4509184.1 bifunctional hydroxymethylpyrimidine kinase/phosphomethylpyrimidine kinase [Eubacteriaceae bacterium]